MINSYEFSAPLWRYPGDVAWHFVSVPVPLSEEIRFFCPRRGSGWGAVRVTVTIGGTRWQTSIFPDKASGSFLLPVKAEVRKKERLEADREVTVRLEVSSA